MQKDILGKLIAWAEAQPSIRAMILTSTRARPDGLVDALSDHDVILAVTDVGEFTTSNAWMHGYGRPAAQWGDQHDLLGAETFFRGVVYDDGAKIDYMIWPDSLLERVAEADPLPTQLDAGYRVLIDKDHHTSRWPTPTYTAHIPPRPTAEEYRALVEEFWWSSTYVAKALWRGEVIFAKFALDHDAKHEAVRRMLEWRIELDHGWTLKPGAYGRGLERLLPPSIWNEFAATYVGANIEENWAALFATTDLFRKVATEVGNALGFEYPVEVDETITAHLEAVRGMPRPSG
jgi:aminoglycoside 6-adenylyltransferase